MATSKTCDICKRPTKRIVAKLLHVPVAGNDPKKRTHSHYTHKADVGECCGSKILQVFNFQPRMTRREYMESRKN